MTITKTTSVMEYTAEAIAYNPPPLVPIYTPPVVERTTRVTRQHFPRCSEAAAQRILIRKELPRPNDSWMIYHDPISHTTKVSVLRDQIVTTSTIPEGEKYSGGLLSKKKLVMIEGGENCLAEPTQQLRFSPTSQSVTFSRHAPSAPTPPKPWVSETTKEDRDLSTKASFARIGTTMQQPVTEELLRAQLDAGIPITESEVAEWAAKEISKQVINLFLNENELVSVLAKCTIQEFQNTLFILVRHIQARFYEAFFEIAADWIDEDKIDNDPLYKLLSRFVTKFYEDEEKKLLPEHPETYDELESYFAYFFFDQRIRGILEAFFEQRTVQNT